MDCCKNHNFKCHILKLLLGISRVWVLRFVVWGFFPKKEKEKKRQVKSTSFKGIKILQMMNLELKWTYNFSTCDEHTLKHFSVAMTAFSITENSHSHHD